MSLNKAMLIGRVGRDPELRGAEKNVCNFSLATSEKYKGVEKTEWHNCVAFAKNAENIAKYVKKGTELFIEGKIQYSTYTAKDGTEKQKTEIVVSNFEFVGSKKKEEQDQQSPPLPEYAGGAATTSVVDNFKDIPF